MKVQEFTDHVESMLEKGRIDNDCWCIVYFSKQDDNYRAAYNLDSGDALIIIEELIEQYGIDPEVVADMYKSNKTFISELPTPNYG